VFSWSYRILGGSAARLFRLLGLHPGPDIGEPAAASLAGTPVDKVRALLTELTRAHLVTEPRPDRYALHDLLRSYAIELALNHEPEPQRRAAQHRMLDHYLHTAHSAVQVLFPGRELITLAPARPGALRTVPADEAQARNWFTAEHAVLLAAIREAAAGGFDTHAWKLAWSVTDFLDQRGHWQDLVTAQEIALEASRRLDDPAGQAHVRQNLARAHNRLGHHDQAHAHLRHALELDIGLGDAVTEAYTRLGLSWVCQQQGDHEQSLHHAGQALERFQDAGHKAGQARALNNLGWLYTELGDHRRALVHCERALALHQGNDDRHGQAGSWHSLGYAHHRGGQHRQAMHCYQRSLDLCRELDDRYYEATGLNHLGDVHDAMGEGSAAIAVWRQALAILDQLHHPDGDQVRAKLDARRSNPLAG
jgi:tetratricopeptide (TPR) repeat protein